MSEAREQLAYLTAQYAEAEAIARQAMTYTTGNWTLMASCTIDLDDRDKTNTWNGVMSTDSDPLVADHIVYHRPPTVLRDVESKRRLLERAQALMEDENWYLRFIGEGIVYDLVQAHDAEEDFRPEWKAEPRTNRDVVLDGELVHRELANG